MMADKQNTRERLIDEMARLVQTKGFNSTSINDVIQAVGIKKGTLYYYFSGKEELGLAVLEKDQEAFLSFLDKNLSDKDPVKSLERFFEAAFKKHKNYGFVGGCLWGNTALEMSDTNPVYKKVVEKVFAEWIVRVESVIRRGQDTGQIRTDRSAGELAHLVVAGIEGGIMISRITKKDYPFKSCLDSIKTMLKSENISKSKKSM